MGLKDGSPRLRYLAAGILVILRPCHISSRRGEEVIRRRSFADGIAKLRRYKDADSRNAWTARSERRGEVWRDDRQSAMKQQAVV